MFQVLATKMEGTMKSVTIFLLLFSISTFSQSYLNLHLIDGSYKNANLGELSKIAFNYTNSTMDFHMSDGNVLSEALSQITLLSLSNVPLGVPLPVELVSFTAIVNGNSVELHWKTQTELNNYGFYIERSNNSNPYQWIKCGFVGGNNNSNSSIEYLFVDHPLESNKYFYRLKQTDNDGKSSYSNIISVDLTKPSQYHLSQNYPNPFNPQTTITYSISDYGFVSIKIFNVLSEEVKTLFNGYQNPGTFTLNFNAIDLPSGIYFCKMQSKDFNSIIKMLLLK